MYIILELEPLGIYITSLSPNPNRPAHYFQLGPMHLSCLFIYLYSCLVFLLAEKYAMNIYLLDLYGICGNSIRINRRTIKLNLVRPTKLNLIWTYNSLSIENRY